MRQRKLKKGDWVILDLDIGQVRDVREDGYGDISNGATITSCKLDRVRKLTLENKLIAEWMTKRYDAVRSIDGSDGFNYPYIWPYFSELARRAIDDGDKTVYDLADAFVAAAKKYTPVIDGVPLFKKARAA